VPACRRISHVFYEWRARAEAYGLDALMPKARRRPQEPNATPTHLIEELLTMAVLEPTVGCRQYADLAERDYVVSKDHREKDPRRSRPRAAQPARRPCRGDHRRHDRAGDRRRA
jgi:hypothetical protein